MFERRTQNHDLVELTLLLFLCLCVRTFLFHERISTLCKFVLPILDETSYQLMF